MWGIISLLYPYECSGLLSRKFDSNKTWIYMKSSGSEHEIVPIFHLKVSTWIYVSISILYYKYYISWSQHIPHLITYKTLVGMHILYDTDKTETVPNDN